LSPKIRDNPQKSKEKTTPKYKLPETAVGLGGRGEKKPHRKKKKRGKETVAGGGGRGQKRGNRFGEEEKKT